jgi:hypothetical protein
MDTHRGTWKRRERQAARLFGAERQPGSGSGGRTDQTSTDSTHPTLFIESKLRASSSVRTLWEQAAARAKREGKTPILMLYAEGRVGGLIVCHEMHLAAVAAEMRDAPGREPEPSPHIEDANEPSLSGDGA